MKVFVILALLAVVVVAHDPTPAPVESTTPDLVFADDYIGEMRESPGGPIVSIGEYDPNIHYGPPSCKLGKKLGNPICFGKCIYKGHSGGYCEGKVCTCVD